ncbi:NAD(P) transhydrogenase subunit alpha [Streptacidiphilus carbonis]|uniref:NAD(P) transhydrogenase subunit alpha n=1 Tax=Streptacidiphilus carbonis TaxID=105422 RepID=UPI0005A817FA|nr:NAD(P) transhydrogenase subunit alpha [Streptacidiphilus carbonis]
MGSNITVGVLRERSPGEGRVALVPETVARLAADGARVLVEPGAGASAWFADADYAAAGAVLAPADELLDRVDALLCVEPPEAATTAALRPGRLLIGLLDVLARPAAAAAWAEQGLTAVGLDLLPRTLSRAQSMDALTSQANIAGYKAVLVAADSFRRFLPMLTTAAGTSKPAAVLVLGAGVAGLQAIATARRLGAVVTGYDVRPESRAEVESLGARFLDIPAVPEVSGRDGYARRLAEAEQLAQQRGLAEGVARADIVVTTARVPGGRPPLLVTAAAVERMRPGSVLVDLAAGPSGGNVELSEPEATVVTAGGVTVIGAGRLPSAMATAASTAYARNATALLAHLLRDGTPTVDLADEIQAAVVVTHSGSVVHPAVAELLDARARLGGTR